MTDDRMSFGTGLLIFLAGAAVGAAVVALTTPKTGGEVRGQLKDMSGKLRDRLRRKHEECCCCEDEDEDAIDAEEVSAS